MSKHSCAKLKIIAIITINRNSILTWAERQYFSLVKLYKNLVSKLLHYNILNYYTNSIMVRNRMSVVESLKELAIYLSRCLPTRSSYLNTYCLEDESPDRSSSPVTRNISRHKIQRKKGLARQVRKPCKRCCEKNITVLKNNKPVEVTTFCNDCIGKPHFCLRCFNIVHHIID